MVNGISLVGISLTAASLIQSTPGFSKWLLVVASALLSIIGLLEIFQKN